MENVQDINMGNEFKIKYTFKISARTPRLQWVNGIAQERPNPRVLAHLVYTYNMQQVWSARGWRLKYSQA